MTSSSFRSLVSHSPSNMLNVTRAGTIVICRVSSYIHHLQSCGPSSLPERERDQVGCEALRSTEHWWREVRDKEEATQRQWISSCKRVQGEWRPPPQMRGRISWVEHESAQTLMDCVSSQVLKVEKWLTQWIFRCVCDQSLWEVLICDKGEGVMQSVAKTLSPAD